MGDEQTTNTATIPDPSTTAAQTTEATTTEPAADQTPAWAKDVPKTFVRATEAETLAEVSKAYKAAQALISKREAPKAPADLGVKPAEEVAAEVAASEAKQLTALAKAGLQGKEAEMVQHWRENGSLAPEHYQKLEKAGYTRAEADEYISGTEAKAQLATMRLQNAVKEAQTIAGGEEQLQTLRQWAAQNMPADKLKRMSDMVTKDPATYPDMIETIKLTYDRQYGGGSPATIKGDRPGGAPRSAASVRATVEAAGRGNAEALAALAKISDADLDLLNG